MGQPGATTKGGKRMKIDWADHHGRYILDDDGEPVPEPALLRWVRWMEHGTNHIVQQTRLNDRVHVSTVFLGLDHNFGWKGPPVLWETMIFGGVLDGYQERYSSLGDAILGHELACLTVLMGPPCWPERSLPQRAS
jgi:hypothetical protein